MKRARNTLWVRGAMAAVLVFAGATIAEAQQPTKVRFAMLTGVSAGHAAFLLAKERGLFAKHGLDVEFVSIDNTPAGIAALANGQVQLSYTGSNLVDAAVAGVPVTFVFGINNSPNFDVCVGGSIRSARDLIGKTIATLNRGTSFDVGLRIWLQGEGVSETEVRITNISAGTAAIMAALTAGVADAATSTATGPSSCRANANRGYRVLADVSAMMMPLFNAGIATSRPYLESNRAVVKGAVAAMVESARLFKENREVAFAHIATVEKLTDPEAIEQVWNFHRLRWADPPLISREALAQSVKFSLNEKTRTEGPALLDRMYDNSLVQEVVAGR